MMDDPAKMKSRSWFITGWTRLYLLDISSLSLWARTPPTRERKKNSLAHWNLIPGEKAGGKICYILFVPTKVCHVFSALATYPIKYSMYIRNLARHKNIRFHFFQMQNSLNLSVIENFAWKKLFRKCTCNARICFCVSKVFDKKPNSDWHTLLKALINNPPIINTCKEQYIGCWIYIPFEIDCFWTIAELSMNVKNIIKNSCSIIFNKHYKNLFQ